MSRAVGLSIGGVNCLTCKDRKHTEEKPFFKPSRYAFSKSFPFFIMIVH